MEQFVCEYDHDAGILTGQLCGRGKQQRFAAGVAPDPAKSAVASTALLWQQGLLGPKQTVQLSLAGSSQSVLLQLNPTTSRAVALDELVMGIDLVEIYLGLDVDPVAVLNASPDLVAVAAELAGSTDYSAPIGDIEKILAANSLPDKAAAIPGLCADIANVLAKPKLLKEVAPLLATTGCGRSTQAAALSPLSRAMGRTALAATEGQPPWRS